MKRLSIYIALVGGITLQACESPVGPSTGAIDLRVLTLADASSESSASEPGAVGQAAQASQALDSARIVVTGPTSVTVAATPGQTVTIRDLRPGSYTVVLEGWEGDEITFTGRTTGIQVTAGESTSAEALYGPTDLGFTALGDTNQLSVTSSTTIAWSSSDDGVATVDASGLITAVSNGIAVITATAGSSRLDIEVTVAQEVSSVTVAPVSATIDPGQTQQFTPTALDANSNPVTGVNFLWVSSNHNVATVNQSGLATGVGEGSATISAVGHGEPGSATLGVNTPVGTVADRVVFTVDPTSNTAGEAFPQAIEAVIQDAGGVIVSDARVAVTLSIGTNPGGGTLSGTVTVNSVNGVASFSGLSIDKVGAGYTLGAASGSLTPAVSAAFDISPAAAASLEFSTQPTNTEGNETFSAAVTVTDAFGNQVPSTVSVSLELSPPASATKASLLGTTTVSAVNGVATFSDLRLGVPATGYRLVARSGTFAKPESQTFNVFVTFVQVDAGRYHTCGVTVNGSAYCWGNNGNGQLGTGSFSQDSVPRLVSGGITFAQVSAGESHTCGLTAAGDAYCWGYNGNGRLGIGGQLNTNVTEPTLVQPAAPLVFAEIEAGGLHTCATTTVSGVADAGYCWGYNGFGQIGNNSTTEVDIPTLVSGGFTFSQISAGTYHSCGIRGSNDQMYCWGYNGEGGVGIGSTVTPQLVPQLVSASLGWIDVAAGGPSSGYFSCGLEQSNNDIYCWGHGNEGEMGDGAFADNLDETQISNQLNWSSVATGDHHVCMLDGNNAAFCVGYAANGQLGNGTTTPNTNVREAVLGGLSFTSITAGYRYTCALTAAGDVYCWGRNSEGQLGDGTRVQKETPVQIVQ
jgi:alpha-tubulin suppressor-like RCC1 family protein